MSEQSGQPVSAAELADRVSVVLLAYNCGHRLEQVLAKLAQLAVPIIAVDNASTDDTAQVLHRAGVTVVRSSVNLGAAGRNLGVERVQTPYVLFCDDDGWYDLDGLAQACQAMDRHPQLALINAKILVGPQEFLDPISVEMAASPVAERHGIGGAVLISFMAGASLMRVTAFRQAGGYDPRFFMAGEEETLAYPLLKAGWQLRYRPELVMHHHPSLANVASVRPYGMRNTLWNAWLHRPVASALGWTLFTLADTPKNATFWRGLMATLAGARWVRRERCPMSRELDADLKLLDTRRFAGRRRLFNVTDRLVEDPSTWSRAA